MHTLWCVAHTLLGSKSIQINDDSGKQLQKKLQKQALIKSYDLHVAHYHLHFFVFTSHYKFRVFHDSVTYGQGQGHQKWNLSVESTFM